MTEEEAYEVPQKEPAARKALKAPVMYTPALNMLYGQFWRILQIS